MNLIKKSLIAILLPIQVLAASPSSVIETNTQAAENSTLDLIQTNTYGTLNLKPIFQKMMPFILQNLKNKPGQETNILDDLKLEMLDNTIHFNANCNNSILECQITANLTPLSSLPQFISEIEKSYAIQRSKSADLEIISIHESAFLIQKADKFYLSNQLTNIDESIANLDNYAASTNNEALKANTFLKTQSDHASLNLSLTDNSIQGELITNKVNNFNSYTQNFHSNTLLSLGGLNLSSSLSSSEITEIKSQLGALGDILLKLQGIEIQGDLDNFQMIIQFEELTESMQNELKALEAEQAALIEENALNITYQDNQVIISMGESSSPNTVSSSQENLIGHFFMNSTPIMSLLENEGYTTPFGFELYTKYITVDQAEKIQTQISLNLDINSLLEDLLSESNNTNTKTIQDVQKDDWYYQNATEYMTATPKLFKDEPCLLEERCIQAMQLFPAQTITRAEFAALILQYQEKSNSFFMPKEFTDLKTDHKYFDEIQTAISLGMLKGDGNGTTIRPDDGLNRAEAITMLQRAFPLLKQTNYSQKVSRFTDVPDNVWYIETLSEAVHEGIIKGTSETTFSPEQQLNRIEAIIMVQRLMQNDILMNLL